MSDYSVSGDLNLDIAAALEAANRVEAAFREALDVEARITADTSPLASEIESAVAAADSEVTVTGQADELTGDVTSAIDAADTTATVEGDTTGLGAEIASAVDAADSEVAVTADTSGVSGEVAGALDSADSTIEVDADTSGLAAEVASAVDAADSTVTITGDTSALAPAVDSALGGAGGEVPLSIDPGPLDEATRAADALDSALIASTSSGAQLRTVLQLGAAGAAAAGLYSLVDAASQLEQSVGGTAAIFGSSQQAVSGFAETAAESAGLTEEAARTLTSQIGGLLQGFGFTQAEAAELSVVMAQLGADLAATFGGTSQDAVIALGAAFRGETDPIERFGISLNATQADLRAVELGLASSTSQVSANARAQGVLSLIMERSAQAQGQFGREVNTTAGQIERARAEAGNYAASVGETLQPAVNDLVALIRADTLPALAELGTQLGPALVELILATAPAFGAFTTVLTAATPLVSGLASALDAIPGPVLAMIGTFLLANRASGPLGDGLKAIYKGLGQILVPTEAVTGAFNRGQAASSRFGTTLKGQLLSAIGPLNLALAAGTIAFTLWADQQAKAQQITRDIEADQQGLQSALSSSTTVIGGVTQAIEDLVESGEGYRVLRDEIFSGKGIEVDIGQVFSDAGADVDQFSDALLQGGDAFDRYVDGLGGTSEEAAFARQAIRDLAEDMQSAADETIESGVVLGDWSESAADAAIAANTSADGTVNYAAALQALKDEARASAEQQEALAAATSSVDAGTQVASLNALGLSLIQLQGISGDVGSNFVTFALAAEAAGLSGSELDAVAQQLGVSSEGLAAAIEGTAGPILELASAAQSTLPTISDLAGNIDEFSVEGFRDRLAEAFEAVVNFQANLQALADNPRVQAAAAILGPEFAQEFADAGAQGREALLAEVDLLLAGLEQQGVSLQELITGEVGPNLVTSTGQVGAAMTENFGANYRPQDVIPRSAREMEGQVALESENFAVAAQGYGQRGTESFEHGFHPDAGPGLANTNAQVEADLNPFAERTGRHGRTGGFSFTLGFGPDSRPGLDGAHNQVEADINPFAERTGRLGTHAGSGYTRLFKPNSRPGLDGARGQITGAGPSFFGAGSAVGSSGTTGFGFGIGGMPGKATGSTSAAISAVSGQTGAASSAGYSVGASIGSGLVSGVQSMVGSAVAGAVNLVNAAIQAAKAQAGVASPSTVFRDEVGVPIGEGLALGMDRQQSNVADHSAALVAAGIDAAMSAVAGTALDPALPVTVPTVGTAGAFGGAGTVVYVQAGAITIAATDSRPETMANAREAARQLPVMLAGRQSSVTVRSY